MRQGGVPDDLRLLLQANDVLPADLCWQILEGYVRTITWDEEGEPITLGFWGPGEWLTNTYSSLSTVDMQCLTTTQVLHFRPGDNEIRDFLRLQLVNAEQLLGIQRIRHADRRLLAMLRWISRRFGQVNSMGYRLSLRDMNLTHRHLAEATGLTRVTVTKNLNRFKARGELLEVGSGDLLIPAQAFPR